MRILTSFIIGAALCLSPAAGFAKEKKMEGPDVVEIADIWVGLNGLVCDFCSIALNKTFKKQEAVRGTYVDLDTKTLSIALNDGADIENDQIVELVEKAGYTATKIKRKTGEEIILIDE